MWPFNKKTNHRVAQKALGVAGNMIPLASLTIHSEWGDDPALSAVREAINTSADTISDRFTREERSTPAFHLKNTESILESLRLCEAGILESMKFERKRYSDEMEFQRENHSAEMHRLETNLENVIQTIAGHEASAAVWRGDKTPLVMPDPIDPPRMTAVGERIAETRHAFTVPEGFEAVRDAESRATGEVRPIPGFKITAPGGSDGYGDFKPDMVTKKPRRRRAKPAQPPTE